MVGDLSHDHGLAGEHVAEVNFAAAKADAATARDRFWPIADYHFDGFDQVLTSANDPKRTFPIVTYVPQFCSLSGNLVIFYYS